MCMINFTVFKDYSHCVFGPTPISTMRGNLQNSRGATRDAQGRGGTTHGGGHRATQSDSRYGQCYTILDKLEDEASNVVIAGIIPFLDMNPYNLI